MSSSSPPGYSPSGDPTQSLRTLSGYFILMWRPLHPQRHPEAVFSTGEMSAPLPCSLMAPLFVIICPVPLAVLCRRITLYDRQPWSEIILTSISFLLSKVNHLFIIFASHYYCFSNELSNFLYTFLLSYRSLFLFSDALCLLMIINPS